MADAVFEIVAGLLGTSATGVLGYTAAKVVSLHREVGEIKTAVRNHIEQEEVDRVNLSTELESIKSRLPNGELHEALDILRGLKNRPRLGRTTRTAKKAK